MATDKPGPLRRLKRWWQGTRSGTEPPTDRELFMRNQCPACRGTEGFLEGPAGGINVNVFCATCGQGFNVAAFNGELLTVERIDRRVTMEARDGDR